MNMIRKMSVLFILLNIFICPSLYASSLYEEVFIGDVEVGQEIFVYKSQCYTIYQVKGQLYLPLSMLEQMGLEIGEKEGIFYLRETLEKNETQQISLSKLEGEVAMMKALPIYCGNIRSFALKVKEETLVPLEVLKAIWQIKQEKNIYWQEAYLQNPLELVTLDEVGIKNRMKHLLPITCVHLYWTGTAYETVEEQLLLEPLESRTLLRDDKKQYLTTYITEISEIPVQEVSCIIYGQKHVETFKQYSQSIRLNELNQIFPPYVIFAQMKYEVGPFKEKQMVELCRSEKHTYHLVKDELGRKYQVPYNSVHIIGEKSARIINVSKEDIEEFATLSRVQSATHYLLWTDVYRQRTYVLKNSDNGWKLEKILICSTGKNNNPTPTGFYEIRYMIPYIGVQKGYRCKYALVFFRDYMYHSILFDKTGKYIKSGQYELGSKASHGCVRLSENDSAWLYNHVPVKSAVWIR